MTMLQVLILGLTIGISIGSSFALVAAMIFKGIVKSSWKMTRMDYFTGQAMAAAFLKCSTETSEVEIARIAHRIAEQANLNTPEHP